MPTIGILGEPTRARIGEDGSVHHPPISMGWWVGADDGWHDPSTDSTARFRRSGVAPSYELAVRVPSGDFVQRVYAVASPSGASAVAIDFENASRAPCSVAMFIGVTSGRARLDGPVLVLDGAPVMTFARRPLLWAGGDRQNVHELVRTGRAHSGEPPEWKAPVEIALLAPVPHKTMLRTALANESIDIPALPDPSGVERGWQHQLDRGMRVELPEELQRQVDTRRADLLLEQPSASVVAALEDWGFDSEAADAWARLGFRARRAARRRREVRGPWHDTPQYDAFTNPAILLLAVRQLLVRERKDQIDLLPEFRPEWLGQPIAVHELPLRVGTLSFALRWHGARPALLWDAPAGVTLRAPVLDPTWQGSGGAGEALLAEPPAPLLAMGTHARSGERIEDPGSFG
ncbi:MAG: hypothetical protein ACRDV7_01845 [Acidimicrobiia bacterium]